MAEEDGENGKGKDEEAKAEESDHNFKVDEFDRYLKGLGGLGEQSVVLVH